MRRRRFRWWVQIGRGPEARVPSLASVAVEGNVRSLPSAPVRQIRGLRSQDVRGAAQAAFLRTPSRNFQNFGTVSM